MNNNIRVFLWLGLALALWMNYSQWQLDYGPKPQPPAATPTGSTGAPANAPSDDTVPSVGQNAPPATGGADALPAAGAPAPAPAESPVTTPSAGKVRVTTDVFVIDIDLRGGTLVYADLLGYPVVKGQEQTVVLFNQASAATNYVLQSGLRGASETDARPTHQAVFTSAATQYTLPAGQDELRVPLTWTDGQGVTVTKTFIFKRSMYSIGLEYGIDNQSAAPWTLHSYARIVRSDPPVERSMFKVESFAFRGPVSWLVRADDDEFTYNKLKVTEPEKVINANLKPQVGGWIAGMQHHFVSAVVPPVTKPYLYSLRAEGNEYRLTVVGPAETVAPGTRAVVTESLFVGPKLQRQLETLHPMLDRVADYTWLTVIAKPLFWMLDKVHSVVGNWGIAIIFVTFLLKLLFYPLSEKAGRSMAKMRALAPRMKALQETYKGDRAKLGQATMELYRTEKVNPLAGCLPLLIQMPVFLAFYWVLLESVEMRQAPFFGWINDLSSRDPYFILPALNGLAMWFQQKLNPPPPDPMQARIFQLMPIIFSVMFALFPAGLVLYWVTNTGLSILQQWNINRKLAADDKSRRR